MSDTALDSNDDPGCYTNDCYFGHHGECRDVDGNWCDCSCHCGYTPTVSPYERAGSGNNARAWPTGVRSVVECDQMSNAELNAELKSYGIDPKCIDQMPALVARVIRAEAAIKAFRRDRGRHHGEHAFCCANNGRCVKCDESYIAAEAALDAALAKPEPK